MLSRLRALLPEKRWLILCSAIMAFLPVVIDMTILHVAVPTLASDLQASGEQILWILDIYPLVMAGLLVPMGTLGDRIGHRTLMLSGLTIFALASVLAAFSVSAPMLIGARGALAIGGSMIMPSVLALIRQAFSDAEERAVALGIWTVVGSAGGAIGPLAGGLLLEHFWWGSVFLINVPIMLVVLPVAIAVLPRGALFALAGRWKIGQAMILTAGLILSVYALKTALKGGASVAIPVLTALSGLSLLGLFVHLQRRSDAPMLDLSLFRHPVIASGLVTAFIASASLAGFELLLAQELQYSLGRTPLEAGLYMLPLAIACAVAGPVAGRLVGWIGLRALSVGGMTLTAGALAALAFVDLNHDWGAVAGLLMILGFAAGSCLLAASVAVMGAAPVEKAGSAGALESTGYELGGALGIAVFGSLINAVYQAAWRAPAISQTLPDSAGRSIGEAINATRALHHMDADKVREAAVAAFSNAHTVVLGSVAALIATLAVALFFALRGRRTGEASLPKIGNSLH